MLRRTKRSPWLAFAGAVLLLLGLQGCTSEVSDSDVEDSPAFLPAGPSVNHAAHMALNIECSDCHDVAETGEPVIPAPETCFDCHDDDLDAGLAAVREYFAAYRQEDGTVTFPKLPFSPDLIMNHGPHIAYGATCEECHGEKSESRYSRPPLAKLKASCMSCHTRSGASNDCAVCHRESRKDKAPASHTGTFAFAHGAGAPSGWQDGEGGVCSMCHSVPQNCNDCHRENKPQSHLTPAFKRNHGHTADAQDEMFTESSCSLCHEEDSCTSCHQTNMPRSHTSTFRRRLHGITAAVERSSCRTCHEQNYCDRCHQETTPISHRGSFDSGRQTHCIACHDPLPMNSCYACHKNTLGHLLATPLPAGLPHSAATDCRTCHSILPHIDDGGSCRRCHR